MVSKVYNNNPSKKIRKKTINKFYQMILNIYNIN